MSTPQLAPEDADKFAAQFKPAWDDEPSAEKAAPFHAGVTMVSASHDAGITSPAAEPAANGAVPPETVVAQPSPVVQPPVEPPKAAAGVVEQGPSVVVAPEAPPAKPAHVGPGMTMRLEPGMIPPPVAKVEVAAPAPIAAKPAVVSYEDDDLPKKEKSKLPLVLGAAAAVLVLGLGAVFAMSGGSKDSAGDASSKTADKPADKAPAPARTDLPKVDPPKDDPPKAADPPKAVDPPKAPSKPDAPVAAAPPASPPVAAPKPAAAPKDPPAVAPAPKKPGKPGGIVRDNPF